MSEANIKEIFEKKVRDGEVVFTGKKRIFHMVKDSHYGYKHSEKIINKDIVVDGEVSIFNDIEGEEEWEEYTYKGYISKVSHGESLKFEDFSLNSSFYGIVEVEALVGKEAFSNREIFELYLKKKKEEEKKEREEYRQMVKNKKMEFMNKNAEFEILNRNFEGDLPMFLNGEEIHFFDTYKDEEVILTPAYREENLIIVYVGKYTSVVFVKNNSSWKELHRSLLRNYRIDVSYDNKPIVKIDGVIVNEGETPNPHYTNTFLRYQEAYKKANCNCVFGLGDVESNFVGYDRVIWLPFSNQRKRFFLINPQKAVKDNVLYLNPPKSKAGFVIGKGGANIEDIKDLCNGLYKKLFTTEIKKVVVRPVDDFEW